MAKNLQVSTTYILTHMGLIFFMYPVHVIESTSEAHWMPIFLGYLFHVFIISIYFKGLSYFKGQNIVQILMSKNKVLAWAVLFPALLYLSWMIVLAVRSFSEVLSIAFLSSTPLWVFILLFLVIPGFIILQGMIGGLLRLSVLLSFLFLIPVLFVMATSFQNVDWHYLFPLWTGRNSLAFVAKFSFYESLFAYLGGLLMLGFLPSHTEFKPKSIFWGSLVLLPAYLISVYVPILTLGEETSRELQFPYLFIVDTIEINWLMFDRINMFLLLSLVAFCMFFISITIWQILSIIQQGIKDINPHYLVPIIIIITSITCMWIPDWKTVDQFFKWNTPLRLYVAVTTPIFVWIVGWLHARKSKIELKKP